MASRSRLYGERHPGLSSRSSSIRPLTFPFTIAATSCRELGKASRGLAVFMVQSEAGACSAQRQSSIRPRGYVLRERRDARPDLVWSMLPTTRLPLWPAWIRELSIACAVIELLITEVKPTRGMSCIPSSTWCFRFSRALAIQFVARCPRSTPANDRNQAFQCACNSGTCGATYPELSAISRRLQITLVCSERLATLRNRRCE